jgi:hypothetical protein
MSSVSLTCGAITKRKTLCKNKVCDKDIRCHLHQITPISVVPVIAQASEAVIPVYRCNKVQHICGCRAICTTRVDSRGMRCSLHTKPKRRESIGVPRCSAIKHDKTKCIRIVKKEGDRCNFHIERKRDVVDYPPVYYCVGLLKKKEISCNVQVPQLGMRCAKHLPSFCKNPPKSETPVVLCSSMKKDGNKCRNRVAKSGFKCWLHAPVGKPQPQNVKPKKSKVRPSITAAEAKAEMDLYRVYYDEIERNPPPEPRRKRKYTRRSSQPQYISLPPEPREEKTPEQSREDYLQWRRDIAMMGTSIIQYPATEEEKKQEEISELCIRRQDADEQVRRAGIDLHDPDRLEGEPVRFRVIQPRLNIAYIDDQEPEVVQQVREIQPITEPEILPDLVIEQIEQVQPQPVVIESNPQMSAQQVQEAISRIINIQRPIEIENPTHFYSRREMDDMVRATGVSLFDENRYEGEPVRFRAIQPRLNIAYIDDQEPEEKERRQTCRMCKEHTDEPLKCGCYVHKECAAELGGRCLACGYKPDEKKHNHDDDDESDDDSDDSDNEEDLEIMRKTILEYRQQLNPLYL